MYTYKKRKGRANFFPICVTELIEFRKEREKVIIITVRKRKNVKIEQTHSAKTDAQKERFGECLKSRSIGHRQLLSNFREKKKNGGI